jgi:type II secretory pathway pseudopilin PulG
MNTGFRKITPRKNERGVALLVALVVVIMVMGIGLAFMGESIFRSKSAHQERELDDGLRIADAAIEQARRFMFLYKANNTWSWDNILTYCNTFPPTNCDDTSSINSLANSDKGIWTITKNANGMTVDNMAERLAQTWPEAPVPPNPTTPVSSGQVGYHGPNTVFGVWTKYGEGAWFMVIKDNDDEIGVQNYTHDSDNQVYVYVTVVMRDFTMRTIEALIKFQPPTYSPQGAIVTNGTMELYGNVNVRPGLGVLNADVISNGNIVLTGSPTVHGSAMAYGTITGSTTGVSGNVVSGNPKSTMPNGDVSLYKPLANYLLLSDGRVTDQAGTTLATGSFYNFSYSSGSWHVTGDSPRPPVAVYYIEGNFDMVGRGTWNATLLVTGNADVRGTGAGWTFGPAMGNVAIVAGTDFKMNGNSSLTGIIVANEQIAMNGNATVNGALIALDKADTSSLVSTSSSFDDSFGGSATIVYPGPQSTFLQVDRDTCDLIYTRKVK